MSKSNFTIWVNEDVYWCLDLIPTQNECEEFVNRCSLIDSKTQQEIEAINFDSEWLVPIFQCRSQIGIKELGLKLKEITDKRGIKLTPRTQMPQDKRIKETKHVGKARDI